MRDETRYWIAGFLIGSAIVAGLFLRSLDRMSAQMERIAVCLEAATRIFRIGGR